jgi:hypothetical protein
MHALMDHVTVAAAKVRKVPILIAQRAAPFGQVGDPMQPPEAMLSDSLDEIIRRAQLRLDQEHIHVSELIDGGSQHTSAAILADEMRALDKLKAYRAHFDKEER